MVFATYQRTIAKGGYWDGTSHIVTFQDKGNFTASRSLRQKFMMATTVREKWGHVIPVWMHKVHNILNNMRSTINIQKNKERNNMKPVV